MKRRLLLLSLFLCLLFVTPVFGAAQPSGVDVYGGSWHDGVFYYDCPYCGYHYERVMDGAIYSGEYRGPWLRSHTALEDVEVSSSNGEYGTYLSHVGSERVWLNVIDTPIVEYEVPIRNNKSIRLRHYHCPVAHGEDVLFNGGFGSSQLVSSSGSIIRTDGNDVLQCQDFGDIYTTYPGISADCVSFVFDQSHVGSVYGSDAYQHWKTCVMCGEKFNYDAHYTTAQRMLDGKFVCDVCGRGLSSNSGRPTASVKCPDCQYTWDTFSSLNYFHDTFFKYLPYNVDRCWLPIDKQGDAMVVPDSLLKLPVIMYRSRFASCDNSQTAIHRHAYIPHGTRLRFVGGVINTYSAYIMYGSDIISFGRFHDNTYRDPIDSFTMITGIDSETNHHITIIQAHCGGAYASNGSEHWKVCTGCAVEYGRTSCTELGGVI